MPEVKARSRSKKDMAAAMATNMHALKHGKHHKDRTHEQEVAIALKEARGEGHKGKKKSGTRGRKRA